MIFRLSFLVLASVASLSVSHSNYNSSKKQRSSNFKLSGKYGSSFQQIKGEEEEEKCTKNLADDKAQQEEVRSVARKMKQDLKPDIEKKNNHREFRFLLQRKELSNVSEMELLHNLKKELEKRRLVVERKLLELYGLKEQQSYIAQLRSQFEAKMAETEMLNDTVNSLRDEIKKLQEQTKHAASSKRQQGMAKRMIEELQMKINVNTRHMRKHLMMLEEQVSGFQGNEISITDAAIEKKLKATRQVELEFVEMQRRNKELELEKRELAVKLVGVQARMAALSTMTEGKIIAKIEQEMSNLRHSNEELSKEVENLQKNRYNMVEELVYQRWLNACLRYEIQNYQAPSSGKTSNSEYLSNNANHKCDNKANELVLCPSFDSISSHTSSTESNEIDSSSTTGSSWNSQGSIGKKSGFMQRIKRWGRSKDDLSFVPSPNKSRTGIGLIRRYSASIVPSRPSMLISIKAETVAIHTPYSTKSMKHESTESPCTPNFPGARRVSFCDSVETVISNSQDESNLDHDEVKDNMEMIGAKSDQKSTIDVTPKCSAKLPRYEKNEVSLLKVITLPKSDYPSDSTSDIHGEDVQVDRRIETTQTDKVAHFTAALLLFSIFMLLVYFLFNVTAGIY